MPKETLRNSVPRDWAEPLQSTLQAPYWSELSTFVDDERRKHTVVPDPNQTFRALELTPFESVRVVILGQDPYPTRGDADGLAYSVSNPSAKTPPSLKNIFEELASDTGTPIPDSNQPDGWARQGVLLLNVALTLRAGSKDDHDIHRKWRWKRQGWRTFTDAVISAVSGKDERVVFILWGNDARKKVRLIDQDRHAIIESAHPSPLSARKGFFGSRPFSRTNQLLTKAGQDPIDWSCTN